MDALVSSPCPNCGTADVRHYCPECGQQMVHLRPTMREILRDFAEEIFHVESRAAQTLRTLTMRPGTLTLDYFEGRRARYIGPVRIYLAMSFVFFALVAAKHAWFPSGPGDPSMRHLGVENQQTGRDVAGIASLDELKDDPAWVRKLFESTQTPEAARTTAARTRERVDHYLPKAMFLLLPLFALITRAVFRTQHYAAHFVFAMHFHSFAFLDFSLRTVAPWGWLDGLLGLWVLVYLYLALLRVFRERRGRTAVKAIAVMALYGLCLGAAIGAIGISGVLGA
jgi:hypothetical protein